MEASSTVVEPGMKSQQESTIEEREISSTCYWNVDGHFLQQIRKACASTNVSGVEIETPF